MSKLSTFVSLLNTPSKLILPAGRNGLLKCVPDKAYLKAVFHAEVGYVLDFDHPQTYNEKLQWLKLYDRRPEYTLYADKFRVRNHIAQTIGEEYLVPLIGVYERAEDIPWKDLPNKFVLKCNHASGTNIICQDKALLDQKKAIKKLNTWMKRNAYWGYREWCYKNIKPCIICEQFIDTPDGNVPDDYKVMCFNGEPKLIQVHHDRFGAHTMDIMTVDWEKTTIVQGVPTSDTEVFKPSTLEKMLELAKILSSNMYFARIDFFSENQRLYFGEITFYPTGGLTPFENRESDEILGSWIEIKK